MNLLYRILSVMLAVSAFAHAQVRLSMSPYETKMDDGPLLQDAFPQRTEIKRSVDKREDYELVLYTVRIFKDPAKLHELSFLDVYWVVADTENKILSASSLAHSFPATRPPDKREFLTFSFSVRASLEASTSINIGRNNGLRTYFTSYRLPLKTVELPEAEQAGADQPANKPADNTTLKNQPSLPASKDSPR